MIIAGEIDVAALTRLDTYGGTAIVKETHRIDIDILRTLHTHCDDVLTLAGDARLITHNAAREIQSLSSSIRHAVCPAEEWQIRNDGVARHPHRIRTGEMNRAPSSLWMGLRDVDLELPLCQSGGDILLQPSQTLGPLLTGSLGDGTSTNKTNGQQATG